MPSFGYSFAPTFEAAQEGRRGGAPPTTSAGTLQTLNYQLPTGSAQQSVNAISPMVSSDRQGKTLADTVLAAVMRTVLGPSGAEGLLSSPASSFAGNETTGTGSRGGYYLPGGRVDPSMPSDPTRGSGEPSASPSPVREQPRDEPNWLAGFSMPTPSTPQSTAPSGNASVWSEIGNRAGAPLDVHVHPGSEGRVTPEGPSSMDFTNAPTADQLRANGGQMQWSPNFEAARVPSGIPLSWAESFIRNNPGDYDRMGSAYGSHG